MLTCDVCSEVMTDPRDIEECDSCGSLVCISCIIEEKSGSDLYCSEECKV